MKVLRQLRMLFRPFQPYILGDKINRIGGVMGIAGGISLEFSETINNILAATQRRGEGYRVVPVA
jgi:hypothetical protein